MTAPEKRTVPLTIYVDGVRTVVGEAEVMITKLDVVLTEGKLSESGSKIVGVNADDAYMIGSIELIKQYPNVKKEARHGAKER